MMRYSPSTNSIFASPASIGRRSNLFIAQVPDWIALCHDRRAKETRSWPRPEAARRSGQKIVSLVKAAQLRDIRFKPASAIAVRANLHFF
jgi:hypothetical protein